MLALVCGLALLSLTALVAACAPSGAPPQPEQVIGESSMPAPTIVPAPEGGARQAAPGDLDSLADQMIVRNADLALQVEDAEKALDQIQSIAAGLNGYLVSTNMWRADAQLRGTATIRVPAEAFDATMDQLKALAIEVEREDITSQDVTEEYTDLSSRLRNLEATEQELLALLTEIRERTRSAEEVLAVHRELTDIRGQIEQIKGRIGYLERMTALATINVELIPQEQQLIVEAGWQPVATLRAALRALVNAGQFLVDAAIWLVVFVLPVLVVLLLPVVVLVVVWRRWRRRRAAKGSAGKQ
jgi:hypothetical protein